MAFCTSCGAQVTGAFCSKCGAPASASAASAGTAVPTPPPAGSTPMPPAPAARGTSPWIWVLAAVGGFIILCFIGAMALGAFVFHKAKEAGLDTDLIRRNPAAAVARMAALANKDVEIVSENDRDGTITLRDRHSGKEVTMSFDQVKHGIRFTADDDNGKTAMLDIGGEGKLPGWIPKYPGSDVQATFHARGADTSNEGEGGNFTFTTSDDPSRVLSFYEEKAKDLGLKVNLTASSADGGTIIATEDHEKRMLTVMVGRDSGQTTVNVTYGEKR